MQVYEQTCDELSRTLRPDNHHECRHPGVLSKRRLVQTGFLPPVILLLSLRVQNVFCFLSLLLAFMLWLQFQKHTSIMCTEVLCVTWGCLFVKTGESFSAVLLIGKVKRLIKSKDSKSLHNTDPVQTDLVKGIVKSAYLLSCPELDERINTAIFAC